MDIQLSNCTVKLIERLTWTGQEKIRAAMLAGVKVDNFDEMTRQAKSGEKVSDPKINFDIESTLMARFKAFEVAIVKITDKDGKEVPFTKEWLDSLSIEDGELLWPAVDKVTNVKKN